MDDVVKLKENFVLQLAFNATLASKSLDDSGFQTALKKNFKLTAKEIAKLKYDFRIAERNKAPEGQWGPPTIEIIKDEE